MTATAHNTAHRPAIAVTRHAIAAEQVRIHLAEAPRPRSVSVQRIDAEHANPKSLWQKHGKPEYLSATDVEQLQRASQLVKEPQSWKYEAQTIQLDITIPPYGVAAITLELASEPRSEGVRV